MTTEKKAPQKSHSDEDSFDQTVITQLEKVHLPRDEKAYILFISGPLIGKMYLLEQAETVIGRADDVDISISDSRISRHHLRILIEGGGPIIEDLGSTNGTFVNGKRIKRHELKNGDKIHISSDTLFKFALGDEAERMFQEEMHQMANYDAVTGVLNKHAFIKRLKEEVSYAKRAKLSLSLLMIDIDFFKKVNDTFGHMAGDYVLNGVAQKIQLTIRDEDILARYGGEEFAVILRGTGLAGAALLAERIRTLVEESPFPFEKNMIRTTISIGIAELSEKTISTPEQLIIKADERLYQSKENGRNRVTAS